MNEILIATHNPAKLARYSAIITHTFPHIHCTSLRDRHITETCPEDFDTSADNARQKADFYANISNMFTLAIDESVHTNFLPDNMQPGVYVRRLMKEKECSDKEVLQYWKQIFSEFPQTPKYFIWTYSLAWTTPNGETNSFCIEQKHRVQENISSVITPGYPMSSFLCAEQSNTPFSESSKEENNQYDIIDFAPFIQSITPYLS